MIKAIIFDCFGVLYLHKGPEFVKTHASNYAAIKNQVEDLGSQANYGLISQSDYAQGIADLLKLPLKEVAIGILEGFGRNDALVDYIEHELRRSYKIGLLSNISRGTMDSFFTNHERGALFDAVALSAETGVVKPSPAAYVNICNDLGVDTSEAIMVDDLLENCRGATLTGMQAVEYKDFLQLKHTLNDMLARD